MMTAYRMLGHLTRWRQGTTTRKHNLKNSASSKSRVRKRKTGGYFSDVAGGVHTPVLSSKFSHTTLTLTSTYADRGEDTLPVPQRTPRQWWRPELHRKKKVCEFSVPSRSRDVTTKLSLGGNNDIITELFLPRGSLVSDISARVGKLVNLFLRCSVDNSWASPRQRRSGVILAAGTGLSVES